MGEAALKALVTLLVTVGPIEVAAMFLALTADRSPAARRRHAWRASLIAFLILLAFALGGSALLAALRVGLPAFRAAGGVLLLGVARDQLFAQHSGLSSITQPEEAEAAALPDLAVFPLAIPLIAGPGSMTAIVLLAGPDPIGSQAGITIGALVVVMAITLLAMLAADRVVQALGRTGANVVARVSGVLLAALAMQFLFDGLRDSGVFR
ncbi:MAG: MarC family protein [Rhodospirillales bacterium]|jgi:multiple antibiotic resistance protein|nr:MarC family protein [Rhodospirillales bacterium]